MRKNIFGTLSLALLLAGCSQESDFDNQGQSGGETFTFVASSAVDANTRTTMDAGGLISWETSDRIMVNGKQSEAPTLSADRFTAEFTVKGVTGQPFDAFYPANMIKTASGDGYSGGKYTFTLPTTQAYKDNVTFGPDMNPSIGTISYTSGESKYKVGFYNLCGLFKVTIKSVSPIPDVSYVQLTLPGGSPLKSGRYTADPKTHTLTAIQGAEKNDVSVHFASPKIITKDGLTLFFVLPPGTYPGGWQLKLLNKNKRPVGPSKTGSSPITIRRSKISSLTVEGFEKISFLIDESNYGRFSTGSSAPKVDDLKKALGSDQVYWDDNGPLWSTPDGTIYRQGIWMPNKNFGPVPSDIATVRQDITDEVRNNPDMTFFPASGYGGDENFELFIKTYDYEGYYWTNKRGRVGPSNNQKEGAIFLFFNKREAKLRASTELDFLNERWFYRTNWGFARTGY